MKKIVLAGLIAVSLVALSQQQASAWVNSRFNLGLNWERQSGGNSFGWGAWRNGQPPGPEAYGQGGSGSAAPVSPFYAPAPRSQGFAPMPQGYPGQGSFDASTFEPPVASQYPSPYQFANYPRQVYYYPAPAYYYYSYGR